MKSGSFVRFNVIAIAICSFFLAGTATAAPGYSITINVVGSGSVNKNPTGPFYPSGANVILTAISNDPTWYFSSWSGDAGGTSNPLNVGMDSNKVITATFLQFPTFTLTLATNGQGSILLSPPGGIYASNTPVTVTATPAAGWVFDSWSGSINGNSNPLPVTITTNLSLTGTFAQLPAFDVQPQGVTNGVGSTVGFSSHAVGSAPLSYQWFFGNSLLSGSTNSTLTLTSVPLANAGNYQVVVTNNYGSATSIVAALVLTNASGSTNVLGVCDEPSLRAAISAGGWVSIMCNGTITLANTINITNQVILDGQNVSLTINGGNTVRLFYVAPGASFSMTNLMLANGCVSNIPAADGGGIYNDSGTVTLVCSVLTNNCAESAVTSGVPPTNSISRGGAIFNRNGSVSLLSCDIFNNTAGGFYTAAYYGWNAYGGSIYNSNGMVKIVCCNFSSNSCSAINTGSGLAGGSAFGGALFQASGSLSITNTTFMSNGALGGPSGAPNYTDGPGYGGALCISGGCAAVDHSQFWGNLANGGNAAKYPQPGYGGAIYSSANLTAESCSFTGNQALAGNSTLDGSITGQGGAIYNTGSGTLSRCSVSSNSVQGSSGVLYGTYDEPGGPAFGGGIYNASSLKITNCTVALNTASGGVGSHYYSPTLNGPALGGGLYNSANATSVLMNVTIASNYCVASGPGFSPANGLAAGVQIANTNGTLRLHNTIIAYGGTNGNAYGNITDDGFNISSDGSANLLGGASYNFTDPKLGPLDYYTGPTLCMALFSNSPAIDFGDSTGAPATDQRWYPRPNGDGVDIGAFEFYAPTQAVLVARLNMGAATSGVGLNFTAFPINIYRLQCSSNLMSWTDVETNGPFANVTNINRAFSTQSTDHRYFRLLLQ